VRLERGAVWVPVRVWRGLIPFLYQKVLAFKLELGVGEARGEHGVVIHEQVLGGDREGTEHVRAQEKQHRVWEGVKGEVGPVLRGRSCLDPREGKAAARIPRAQDPVVRGLAVKGRRLHVGREPCGPRVEFRGGAHDPKVRPAALVHEEKSK